MLGVAAYDSDDDEALAASITAPASVAQSKPAAGGAPAPSAVSGAPAAPKGRATAGQAAKAAPKAAGKKLFEKKLREILKEIDSAKSATAVVKLVRHNLKENWDVRWGAEALYQVAKRSTARTRKEWAVDATVKTIADKLCASASDACVSLAGDSLDTLLVALDALRRMDLQEATAQQEPLERAQVCLVAEGWRRPVKILARLFWLGAPLKEEEDKKDFSSLLPGEIRSRSTELDGPDLALLVAAMQNKAARDDLLLERVITRMRTAEVPAEVLYKGVSATDLVEMAEGLKEVGVQDEAALRPLGQEVLRRRGELTPYESHRVHSAYEAMKLPLPKVWLKPGSYAKRQGDKIVTTTAFAPQEGHEKKRRGNNDIERTSPPRVVRDYKMMSY